MRQGLSNPSVTCITKDAQGFLWIGTQNGVNRFDGYNFVPYYKQADTPYRVSAAALTDLGTTGTNELLMLSYGNVEVLNTSTGKADVLLSGEKTGNIGFPGDLFTQDGQVYTMARENDKDVLYRYIAGKKAFEVTMPGIYGKPAGLNDHFDFVRENDGTYWMAYITEENLAVYHVTAAGKTIHKYGVESFEPKPAVYLTKKPVGIALLKSKNGSLFVSVKGQGIYCIDKKTDVFKSLPLPKEAFFSIAQDTVGNVLVYDEGVQPGQKTVWLIRPTMEFVDYSEVAGGMDKLNAVYSDNFDSWLVIGGNDGLRKATLKSKLFTNYVTENKDDIPGYNSMRGICRDQAGNVLFTAEMSGVHVLTRDGSIIKPGKISPSLAWLDDIQYPRTILKMGDSMLLIAHSAGLTSYFPLQKRLETVKLPIGVSAMALGKDGLVWFGSFSSGISSFDPQKKQVRPYLDKDGHDPAKGKECHFLLYDKKGRLWVGMNEGMMRIDVGTKVSKTYNINPGGENYAVICINEDSDGMLWLATLNGGLQRFNPNSEKIEAVYRRREGLCNESIASILPDEKGNLWLGTYSGLAWFNRSTNTFVNFYDTDGLPNNEFNRHSFFKDPSTGVYYLGGINGVTSFYPQDVIKPALNTPVLVSHVSYMSANGRDKIDKHVGLTNGATIELPAVSRWLNLQLSLASYENPAGNQFSYKVEGLDDDWHYLGHERSINFTHLPSGKYLLRLRGTTSRRGWPSSEYVIKLVIHDFWYNQWWVKILFASLLALSAFLYYRFLLHRRLSLQEAKRLAELDAFKTRFFTNITHEFRTPLTVILGTAGQIEDGVGRGDAMLPQNLNRHIGLIRRSGENLLRLINQILDLARLEHSSLPVKYIHGDVVAYVRYIADSHHAIAEAYNIQMAVQSSEQSVFIDYDPDRLQQIIHNLISNALKFTAIGGAVTVTVNRQGSAMLTISVEDNGGGIPKEDLPKIFERFYQAKNQLAANTGGTGIGLSFVKELLKSMGGSITVDSVEGKGSTFTVSLPVFPNAGLPINAAQQLLQNESYLNGDKTAAAEDGLPLLLIIEDNPDVVELLLNLLGGLYRIDFAYNGEAGIQKAFEQIPDLIISDLMMPVKDGFQVLETLKNDRRTSHIPVVLLTARAMVEDRIAGLKRGADAYLSKPFHHGELMVTLNSVLGIRAKLQERYVNYSKESIADVPEQVQDNKSIHLETLPETLPDTVIWQDGVLQLEDEFLHQLYTYISERLEDANLSVEQVSQAMGMSQSVLYRKLTALTGQSLVPFIRTIRMQKAKTLLLQTSKSVSEVAYETGFTDSKFFSKVFQQEFGMRPKAFRSNGNGV